MAGNQKIGHDAALDETNVRRFAGALREMTGQSQFVVISHNKATMEQADALYGVTLEEPGASRLLSVSLAEPAWAERGAIAAPIGASLAAPTLHTLAGAVPSAPTFCASKRAR